MAPEICRVCGDNRSLKNHDECANCMARRAQLSGEVFESGYRGDGL